MSFNKIIILGNLGSDPDLKFTSHGVAVCTANVAINHKQKGEESTLWIRATLWRERAESFVKYFKKGDTVYLEGRLSQSEWTDKEGTNRTTLEVDVSNWEFVGGKQD